jgi:tRNA(Ile)-lysidine synthase TilS/MesJ/uncharacterized protein (DUF924 family)
MVFKLTFKLDEIVNYWFNGGPELWFQCNQDKQRVIDSYISHRFGNILQKLETILAESQCESQCDVISIDACDLTKVVAIIIVLDQFSRHIYRGTNVDKIKQNTIFALNISTIFLKQFRGFRLEELKYLAFLLMPFKHIDIYHYWNFISAEIYKYDYKKCPILYRFYKDSITKYAYMVNSYTLTPIDPINNDRIKSIDDFLNITDFLPSNFWNIREVFHKTLIDMKNNERSFKPKKRHPIFNSVLSFLQTLLSQQNVTNPIITISLSGGVDSMVSTFVLAVLSQLLGTFQLQAAHLNYLNRKVSTDEANFDVWYCKQLDIPIFLRTINEIQRGDEKRSCNNIIQNTSAGDENISASDENNPISSVPLSNSAGNRDFYESLTRKIRFDMYDKLPKGRGQTHSFVVLGHNHDDIVENIWTNFAKGNFIFNLKKMEFTDMQENVLILRPLLHIKKDIIYEFSKMFDIAYLKKTTPDWSNRGKIRTKFLPTVSATFGDQVNIEYVADTLHEYGKYIETSLVDPLLSKIVYFEQNNSIHDSEPDVCTKESGKYSTNWLRTSCSSKYSQSSYDRRKYCSIPIEKFHLTLGAHFWGTIFGTILRKIGTSDPTRKSIEKFVQDLKKIYDTDKHQTKKINIKKGVWGILLKKKSMLVIYIDNSLI